MNEIEGGCHPPTEDGQLEKTKVFDLGRVFTTEKSDDHLPSRSKNHSDSPPVSSLAVSTSVLTQIFSDESIQNY